MMIRAICVCLVIVMMGCGASSTGQTESAPAEMSYEEAVERIKELVGSAMLDIDGDPDAYLRKHMEATEIARRIGHKGLEAMTVAGIGAYYKDAEQYEKAIGYFEQSKDLLFETVGKESPTCIYILSTLGDLWMELKDYKKAVQYIEHALAITIKESGEDSLEAADLMVDLASNSYALGGCELALPHCEKSRAIFNGRVAPDDTRLGRMNDCLAECQGGGLDPLE